MQRESKPADPLSMKRSAAPFPKERMYETATMSQAAAVHSNLLTTGHIAQLQRTVGNKAVQKLLSTSVSHNLHNRPEHQVIQAKLGYHIISHPDYEYDSIPIYDAPNGTIVEDKEYFTGEGVEVIREQDDDWSEISEPQEEEDSEEDNQEDHEVEDDGQDADGWTRSGYLAYQPKPDKLDATWSKSNGKLYKKRKKGKIPAMTDVRQGDLGDCFFLSPLAAIASTPKGKELIKSIIVALGDGKFEVGFHGIEDDNSINAERETETVDAWFPETSSGKFLYNPGGKKISDLEVPIWSAIIEKAYAQWDTDGYSGLDMENASRAIAHLTGLEPKSIEWDAESEEILEKVAWRSDTFEQEVLDDAEEDGRAKSNVDEGQLFEALSKAKKDPNMSVVAESLSVTEDDSDYLDKKYRIKDSHVYVVTSAKDNSVTLWDPQGSFLEPLPIAKFKELFDRVLCVNVADAPSLRPDKPKRIPLPARKIGGRRYPQPRRK